VLQNVRVPLRPSEAGSFRTILKDPEELAAVHPTALLRRENVIGTVTRAIFHPLTQGFQFIQQRLPSMATERLARF
jgi:hypothetical protein